MEAKIWDYNGWIAETNPDKLCQYFGKAIADAGFHVLDTLQHHFDPYGFTKLYLLCESHFAIHTFPEEGKTYIQLSSCNQSKFDKFLRILQNGKAEGVVDI